MTKTEFQSNAVRELPRTYAHALPVKGAIMELAGIVYDSLKLKGSATAAVVEALTDAANGDAYIITTGGTVDTLTTTTGDILTYDEPNGVFIFLINVA